MAKNKINYYSLDRILTADTLYYIIFGMRSNGKSYATYKHCAVEYFTKGFEFVIIRRWQEDFMKGKGQLMFKNLNDNGEIIKLSNGEWEGITFKTMRFYLFRHDEKGKQVLSDDPIGYAIYLSGVEHDKSTGGFGKVQNIVFDEFLTRGVYLPDEFNLLANAISTVLRERDGVKVFMLGNTVSQHSPYWEEFGIDPRKLKPGDMAVYYYGEDGETSVAVEFTDNPNKEKGRPSDKYFGFNNPKLNMIKGTGEVWEMEIYPHLKDKYKPKDVIFTFFIVYNSDVLQCEIISKNGETFTYIHKKTTPIQNPDKDFVFTPEFSTRPNWNRRITRPTTPAMMKISRLFNEDSVVYQTNYIGETVRAYLQWCKTGT